MLFSRLSFVFISANRAEKRFSFSTNLSLMGLDVVLGARQERPPPSTTRFLQELRGVPSKSSEQDEDAGPKTRSRLRAASASPSFTLLEVKGLLAHATAQTKGEDHDNCLGGGCGDDDKDHNHHDNCLDGGCGDDDKDHKKKHASTDPKKQGRDGREGTGDRSGHHQGASVSEEELWTPPNSSGGEDVRHTFIHHPDNSTTVCRKPKMIISKKEEEDPENDHFEKPEWGMCEDYKWALANCDQAHTCEDPKKLKAEYELSEKKYAADMQKLLQNWTAQEKKGGRICGTTKTKGNMEGEENESGQLLALDHVRRFAMKHTPMGRACLKSYSGDGEDGITVREQEYSATTWKKTGPAAAKTYKSWSKIKDPAERVAWKDQQKKNDEAIKKNEKQRREGLAPREDHHCPEAFRNGWKALHVQEYARMTLHTHPCGGDSLCQGMPPVCRSFKDEQAALATFNRNVLCSWDLPSRKVGPTSQRELTRHGYSSIGPVPAPAR